MNANMLLKSQVNAIIAPYTGYQSPQNIRRMYDALNAMGVTVGLMTDRKDVPGGWESKTTWYFDGEEIENSWFIYKVYEGNHYGKKDYVIYVS